MKPLIQIVNEIISNRPEAICFVHEVMNGDRRAPAPSDYMDYIESCVQAGACRLSGEDRAVYRKATQQQLDKAVRHYCAATHPSYA